MILNVTWAEFSDIRALAYDCTYGPDEAHFDTAAWVEGMTRIVGEAIVACMQATKEVTRIYAHDSLEGKERLEPGPEEIIWVLL